MKQRVLIIDTDYERFLDDFYKRHKQWSIQSFENLRQQIFDACPFTANFYSTHLRNFGYVSEEIIANDKHLQKKWARENCKFYPTDLGENIPGVRILFGQSWLKNILWSQIKEFAPDILYVQDLSLFNFSEVKKIKRAGCLLIGQSASTFPSVETLRGYDIIFTAMPHMVTKFEPLGVQIKRLDLCFEEDILNKLQKQKPYNVTFVGGFSRHHLKGTDFLSSFEYLAKKVKVDFWGYGLKNLEPDSPIRKTYHGEAWGLDMYNVLFNSKITINRHIGWSENFAANMRLYEATGVGSMLITDYKDNLGELFEVGKEIETYKGKEELVDKVKYYFAHERAREKIAKAGQRRTLRDHTYKQRIAKIVAEIEKFK